MNNIPYHEISQIFTPLLFLCKILLHCLFGMGSLHKLQCAAFLYIIWRVHQYLLQAQKSEFYLDLLALPQNCEELLLDLSCLCVCPSICVQQFVSHETDYYEVWYLRILQIFVKKIQVSLNSDKNIGTLREDQCTFMIITRLILLQMRNIAQNYVREITTHIFCSIYFSGTCVGFVRQCGKCGRAWQTKYDKIIRRRKDAVCRRLIWWERRSTLYL